MGIMVLQAGAEAVAENYILIHEQRVEELGAGLVIEF